MAGKTIASTKRINFGSINLNVKSPNLLDIQVASFQEFLQLETTPENRANEGIFRVFQKIFPFLTRETSSF
jgi:DNA-directed RNA polymerase subunit beta